MSLYIQLIKYTDQGIKTVKESPQRADAAKKLLADLGGEMKAIYLTMGSYDIVVISEIPNGEIAAQFALTLGSQGNIRTDTLTAFDEAQYRKICGTLP